MWARSTATGDSEMPTLAKSSSAREYSIYNLVYLCPIRLRLEISLRFHAGSFTRRDLEKNSSISAPLGEGDENCSKRRSRGIHRVEDSSTILKEIRFAKMKSDNLPSLLRTSSHQQQAKRISSEGGAPIVHRGAYPA